MQIALLEDDLAQAALMSRALSDAGRTVFHAVRGSEFFRMLADCRPSAFVIDWHLPDMQGAVLMRRLRQLYGRAVPVIVVTSDRSETVALTALALDADDFVHKPVSPALLRARFDAVMRRHARQRAEHDSHLLHAGAYALDRRMRTVQVGGAPVALSPREFDLAWLVFENAERFLSRGELLAGIWGRNADTSSHSLSQHVHAIRRKLRLAEHGFHLMAVYGAGYRLVPAEPRPSKSVDE